MRAQSGSVLAELAMSALLFILLLLAIIEFGRLMLTYSAIAEASRVAARLAAICGPGNEAGIRQAVSGWARAGGHRPADDGWLQIGFLPAGCSAATCTMAEAWIEGYRARLLLPGPFPEITLPAFPARVSREAFAPVVAGWANPGCPRS